MSMWPSKKRVGGSVPAYPHWLRPPPPRPLQDCELLQEVCGWINAKATIPVWAKMTPNITGGRALPQPRPAPTQLCCCLAHAARRRHQGAHGEAAVEGGCLEARDQRPAPAPPAPGLQTSRSRRTRRWRRGARA